MFEALFEESGLSLERLRTFCMVAEHGGFSKAALGDSVRQSQFSHQVAALEQFFKTPLLERRGRTVVLTNAGADLHRRAAMILGQLEEFKLRQARGIVKLRIGAGSSVQEFLLGPVLIPLLAGDGSLHVDVESTSSDACEEAVRGYRLDLAIARPPRASRGLTLHALAKSRLVAIVARGAFREAGERSSLVELGKLPTVLLRGSGVLRSSTLDVFRRAGVTPNLRIESSTFLEVKRFVAAGLGVAYVPDYILREEDERTLRSWIVPQMRTMRREVVLFHLAERTRDGAFEKLVGRLVSDLRRLTSW
jgi:DNA-binding transcriptional LysR family regulator